MSARLLKSLSMSKYERLLPRMFPGAVKLEIKDRHGSQFWCLGIGGQPDADGDDDAVMAWSDFGPGIERRQLHSQRLQFRTPLSMRDHATVAWLIASYDLQPSVPMATAPEPLRRAFADAKAFLQEELELQSECDQLAVELTERYEELNLMYSTHEHVEQVEEGQQALSRLVHNCADYLDVAVAVLTCRDLDLDLHSISSNAAPGDVDALLEILNTKVYDRIESLVEGVVINTADEVDRKRLLDGRPENVLAMPIKDDHGTAAGMIGVVAREHGYSFTNGDRNLLEVMAKKASRIIHTHHDSLTGLMNRSGFESILVSALTNARSRSAHYCLMHVNIDQLHVVNDLLGHQEGDALIRRVARVLRATLRDSDYLARLDGDEFAVLATSCDARQGHGIADKIRAAIGDLKVISGHRQLDVSACIGVASIDAQSESIVGVLASAEIACKAAKEGGRDRVQIFEESNTSLVRRTEEIEWIGRVQQALRDDNFRLFCQPVMPLASDRWPNHYEILVRMFDDNELHLPGKFLPAAERYQQMPQIDRWVIRNTLKVLGNRWDMVEASGAVFCVNLSGQSLTNGGFLAYVADELDRSPVHGDRLCFEITETAAIANMKEATAFINIIREMGCRFSLDDFGAGLSSFGYLKELPVDYLKIDGSFIREVTSDEVSLSMVEAICQIARTMGLQSIAEYVGDEATVEVLRRTGVDYVQGFHIGKPVPVEDILARLQDETAASA